MTKPTLYLLVRSTESFPGQPLGTVAHVVEWTDGTCLLKWLTEPLSEERYPTLESLNFVRLASNRCELKRIT